MPEYTPELRAKVDAAIDWMTAPKPLALGANQYQHLADISTWLRSVDSAKARLAGFAPALTAHIDAQAELIAELEANNARLREGLSGLMVGGGSVMEDILWGDLPDNKTGTMTFQLGALRKARAALKDTAQ